MSITHTVSQLGQSRPADTTAVSVYSPAASTQTIVHNIIIANTSGSATTYRLYFDDDGTTYDETTALAWDIAIGADEVNCFECKITMNAGNVAVRSGSGNALTFTVNGEEFVTS